MATAGLMLMKISRPTPLYLACAKKAADSGYPDPVWTGTHLIATNGRILVATDVELDEGSDAPAAGYVPKEVLEAAIKRLPKGEDADTAELHVDIALGGAKAVVFDGAVETFSAQGDAANLALSAPDVTKLIPPRTNTRLQVNAKQLYRLAKAMGCEWLSLYVTRGQDGEVESPVRVEAEVRTDGPCEHVLGVIAVGEVRP